MPRRSPQGPHLPPGLVAIAAAIVLLDGGRRRGPDPVAEGAERLMANIIDLEIMAARGARVGRRVRTLSPGSRGLYVAPHAPPAALGGPLPLHTPRDLFCHTTQPRGFGDVT